jgi:hypothetical protein
MVMSMRAAAFMKSSVGGNETVAFGYLRLRLFKQRVTGATFGYLRHAPSFHRSS